MLFLLLGGWLGFTVGVLWPCWWMARPLEPIAPRLGSRSVSSVASTQQLVVPTDVATTVGTVYNFR